MVLQFKPQGIYCPAGDFFIDPMRPVDRALITHGHADHARTGHKRYLATSQAAPVMRHRLGKVVMDTIEYGETRRIGGALVSFHPAGHVPGSAQIRVEVDGEVWVVSGDYKTEADGLSEPFEPVRCHTFITECTFGLPVYKWDDQAGVMASLNEWWQGNRAKGRCSVIGAYSLGKAQRIIANIDANIGPILVHSAIENTNEILRAQGYRLPPTVRVTATTDVSAYTGALVIAPPSALNGEWITPFGEVATGFASGWMRLRGHRRRRSTGQGFVLSDHADWEGLNGAIRATGAERVFATHGYTSAFARWLKTQGYDAGVVQSAGRGAGGAPREQEPEHDQ
ncbi:MAG: ligase-associated DNA damage response exonuclease [Pikeienuella sp.]